LPEIVSRWLRPTLIIEHQFQGQSVDQTNKKKSQNYVHIKAINVASVLIEQADFEQDLRSHTFAAGETTGVWSTNNGQGGQAARHKGVQVI